MQAACQPYRTPPCESRHHVCAPFAPINFILFPCSIVAQTQGLPHVSVVFLFSCPLSFRPVPSPSLSFALHFPAFYSPSPSFFLPSSSLPSSTAVLKAYSRSEP